jgi:hypothetical protein
MHDQSIQSKKVVKKLLGIMLLYIQENKLDDRSRGGCHLCIQNGYYIDMEFRDMLGYIQVDPINYYRMNPDREIWYEKYKNDEFYVVT